MTPTQQPSYEPSRPSHTPSTTDRRLSTKAPTSCHNAADAALGVPGAPPSVTASTASVEGACALSCTRSHIASHHDMNSRGHPTFASTAGAWRLDGAAAFGVLWRAATRPTSWEEPSSWDSS